jgi:hypothetical protein
VLCCQFRYHPSFDEVSDQAARPFDKCEFVGETALEQYANAIVAGHVRHSDHRYVLADAKANQMIGLRQDMATEDVDRCCHSIAVLLPDGRVFSGGGGEYAPNTCQSNSPADTHADAQLFSPPYLFKGQRPRISKAPTKVVFRQTFNVETPDANDIGQVTWVRLASMTHCFDQSQPFLLCYCRLFADR